MKRLINSDKLEVIYEDNHIIVVIKPFNIPTQEDDSGDPDFLSIIKKYIKEKYNKPGNVFLGMVHRIDRPVGGLMLFAKTSKAASRMSDQIRRRVFHKEYTATVAGFVSKKKGKLVHYLVKDKTKNKSRAYDDERTGSKRAELFFEVVGATKGRTLLSINLITGRSHQIRAQLSAIGHPVIGDLKYGAPEPLAEGNILLFATRLSFEHPVKKEPMDFEVAPPDEFLE